MTRIAACGLFYDDLGGLSWQTPSKQPRIMHRDLWKEPYHALVDAENPEIIFLCPIAPRRQQHFPFLGCKVFVACDNILPDWRYCDWGISFAPESARNFHTSQYDMHPTMENIMNIAPPPDAPRARLAEKTKFCAFVYANSSVQSRNHFFELLAQKRHVSAYGAVCRNKSGAPPLSGPYFRYLKKFYRVHKFVIAFENVRAAGYSSEKLWNVFRSDAVPIYLGDPDIAKRYNPDAFIHARDFDSLEHLADYVLRVDADDELYLRYLSAPRLTAAQQDWWRRQPAALDAFLQKVFFTPRVGSHAPRAQRDSFLREIMSRLGIDADSRIMPTKELDFRPNPNNRPQMQRVWQGGA